ncbi:hypothetical protein F5148DRAFT_95055 [Russula earlei]|uniref:Uncharacterized protein n=1 Tax=Russula earlei TaxID=71964 RepID=A0ACC0U8N5_9AGAM|nr:hypothetical protein F5148DRAFT_95055 [Russula earlei]
MRMCYKGTEDDIQRMTDYAWLTLGNAANVVSLIAGGAGAVSIYQSYGSPDTSLEGSEIMLDKATCQSQPSHEGTPKSPEQLETELEILSDAYCRLKMHSENASVPNPDDIGFNPSKASRLASARPANLNTMNSVSMDLESSPDTGDSPMSLRSRV